MLGKENPQLALDYLNIGLAYDKKGESEKTLEMYLKAQALAQKGPDRQLVVKISRNLGELYYKEKKYAEAKKALQSGIDLVEKARTSVGAGKAEIILRTLHGEITTEIPASLLRPHPNAVLFVDAAAAASLPTEIV